MNEFMATAVKPEASSRAAIEFLRQPWRLAAIAILGFLFVVSIYRAATQSISHDEAVTWEWLPYSQPITHFFDSEIANHHPLNNFLGKLMADIFGLSEFSLRIPSLLGGLLYFYTVFQMSALLFGESFLFLLSVALLSLNPFVLDYLCCARGYAMGLGFLSYGIYQAMLYLSENWSERSSRNPTRLLNKAGVAIGLSMGSNVVMTFPCGAFTAAFLAILLADHLIAKPAVAVESHGSNAPKKKRKEARRRAEGDRVGRSFQAALLHYLTPAIVVGGFILLLPKTLVYFEEGYEGPASLLAILESIVRPSVLHSPRGWLGLLSWIPSGLVIQAITRVIVPVGLVALIAVGVQIARGWIERRSFDALPVVDRFLLLVALLLPAALALIVASRYILHAPYPEQRTVLYWVPLLSLMWVSFMKKLYEAGRFPRIAAASLGALAGLAIVQFATQFNTRYYAEWAYSAATKDMMAIVRARHPANAGERVRLGVTWQLEPGVNFYRTIWGLDWVNEVRRESPDADYDYYLLLGNDAPLVERRGLKVLFRDQISGSVLAERRKS